MTQQQNADTLTLQHLRTSIFKDLLGKFLLQFFQKCKGVIVIDFLDKSRKKMGITDHSTIKNCGRKAGKVFYFCKIMPLYTNVAMIQGSDSAKTPLYSSDLASSDSHVFPQLRIKSLKGDNFSFNKEMIDAVEAWFTEQEKIFFERCSL